MGYDNTDNGLDGRWEDTNTTTLELCIGLMIASLRGLPMYLDNQSKKIWRHSQQKTLANKNIAVIGNGSIGRRVKSIKLIMPDVKVVNFSKHGANNSLKIEEFDNLIHTFDVIVVFAPLTEETKNMFNEKRFSQMKDGCLFINMSKGGLVNTKDLINELNKDRIFAVIDQVNPDPLPTEHPLWDCPNLIITPHVGSNAK
jgi:phosphoglycerate dehydrogenase-like enzyme